MRAVIVGGGPGGLFLAYLLKKHDARHQVDVFEQNGADSTYGWGLVFSGVALRFVERTDPDLYAELMRSVVIFPDMEITHRGIRIPVANNPFARIGRLDLLRMLQRRCASVGVRLHFNARIDDFDQCRENDLLVGADGVSSRVRSRYAADFRPEVQVRPNYFAWYGTPRLFPRLSLIFREGADGLFIAHAYQYGPRLSTFLVECAPAVFERARLADRPEAESLAYIANVFADDLGGETVLSNRAGWFNASFVRTARMYQDNVVLIGDAQRTVHFSIGSGTRMALQDAIALFEGLCDARSDIPEGLRRYEEARRPSSQDFQTSALRSLLWYENVQEIMELDPWAFTYSYFTRTGKVAREDMQNMDAAFVAELDRRSPGVRRGEVTLYPKSLTEATAASGSDA